MNCKNCGFQLSENDLFCKNCGTPVNNQSVQNNNDNLNNQNTAYAQPSINPNIQNPNVAPNNQNLYGANMVNQQNAQQQPSWMNSYNMQPIKDTSKNDTAKFIIIGIVIAILIVGVIVAINIFNSKKTNNSEVNGGNATSNTTNVNKKSTYSVNFEGFKFSIPDNLVYEKENGVLLIGNEEGTWLTQLEIGQGSYESLKSNKNQLQSSMQQNGYNCTAVIEKTFGGVNFLSMEASFSGQNMIIALAKANSMYFMGITAINQSNEIDYNLLETIAPIISSAEFTSSSNNLSSDVKLDMSAISGLAK